jgi:hypothetical protein
MCSGFDVQPACHEWGLIAGIATQKLKQFRSDVLCDASRERQGYNAIIKGSRERNIMNKDIMQ